MNTYNELFGNKVKKAVLIGSLAVVVVGCSTTSSGQSPYETQMIEDANT